MRAVVLSIGDELVLGQIVDTNAAYLSARLAERGVMTRWRLTVPDDRAAIAQAVQRAAQEAELVIATGGLGPTRDDLTRQALADVLGVALERHAPSAERIERFFRERGRMLTESNLVQAMCPESAEMLDNPCGTAPGIRLRLGQATVLVLPGVPNEMRAMFDLHIAPLISGQAGQVILSRKINVFGIGEALVGEKLGGLMARDRNPKVGTTVAGGVIAVRIRAEFKTAEQALAEIEQTTREVRARLGSAVFGEDEVTLQDAVGRLLEERGLTVAVAESCSGGLVAKLLTERPGASAYFLGGWVVYANRLKQTALGVPGELLERHGAVSAETAQCMAEQALKKSGADYALALTGIAGPGGGTPEKPVGTVWIALGVRRGSQCSSRAEQCLFPGERELVRERAARTALNMLRLELIEPT